MQFFIKIKTLIEKAHWMDPLPSFHRHGIVIALLVIVLAFLWPDHQSELSLPTKPQLNTLPLTRSQMSQSNTLSDKTWLRKDTAAGWHSDDIAPRQTLAQLFHNNFKVTDASSWQQSKATINH